MKSMGSKLLDVHIRTMNDRHPVYLIALANALAMDAARLDAFRRGAELPSEDEAVLIESATGISRTTWTI
jgi:hypothetical protein